MAELARRHSDRAAQALALNRTATIRAYEHDYASAAALLEEALPLAEESGDQRALAETNWNQAQMGLYGGDPAAMKKHATRALELARELEDEELIARCLNALAYDARNRCRPLKAVAYADEALELTTQLVTILEAMEKGFVEEAGKLLQGGAGINATA